MRIGFETENIEFKRSTGELKAGVISLASMLNKHGYGTLYFGVSNNGEVIGQQIGDRTLRDISQAIAEHIKPQIIPSIVMELMENKNIIKIYAQGTDAPYSAYGKYYMRSADEDRELTPDQLRSLMFRRSQLDMTVKTANGDQNLTFNMLRTLYASKGLTVNDNSFEKNLGLIMDDGRYNLMAGLLADNNDVSIKVVTFKGRDKREMIRRNEYGYKCLLISMEQALNYVESINETSIEIGTHQRSESPLFDMLCFREAWINACLHTRWERLNPPAVYIFSDRIEIISTGGLPEDLTKDEFYSGISRPVNIKLQKIFGQLGYVEQTGHGVPLIINNYGKQAFDIMDNYLSVTIPFSRRLRQSEDHESITYTILNDSQMMVRDLLADNPRYTIKDLVRESSLSDGYVRKIITELKSKNILERIGSNKTGHWKVKD